MPIDFPSAPALNDVYSYAGRTWRYDGSGWVAVDTTSFDAATAHFAAMHAEVFE